MVLLNDYFKALSNQQSAHTEPVAEDGVMERISINERNELFTTEG